MKNCKATGTPTATTSSRDGKSTKKEHSNTCTPTSSRRFEQKSRKEIASDDRSNNLPPTLATSIKHKLSHKNGGHCYISFERQLLVRNGVTETVEAVLVDLLDGSQVLALSEFPLRDFICVFKSWFRLRYSRFSLCYFYSCSCCCSCTSMKAPFAYYNKDYKNTIFSLSDYI